ncbi:MAG: flavodoxin family protein [Candidatus Kapabacteria bacterium]|nr:flavodoxin family protein [Ignavibacteriota bacterium]MCW5884339.1 flavodoxin family protein [Candidatus Kapabacteria bacterium]
MKVLILDCVKNDFSPELKPALDKFVEGIESAGGQVSLLNIKDLDIKPCFSCTTQSSFKFDDKCRCDDDMNRLYPEFRNHDSWVFISHINSNGSTNYLKNLLDRMEPLFQPVFTLDSMEVAIPPDNKLNGKIALLSSYEYESADLARNISDYIDSISLLFSKQSAGSILFERTRINNARLDKFYDAGKKLITNE